MAQKKAAAKAKANTTAAKKTTESSRDSGGSWYSKDREGGFKQKHQQDALAKQRKELGGIFRFSVKVGEKAKICFVDTNPVFVHEHRVKIADRYETFTCTRGSTPCRICDATDKRPSYTAYLTVIDTRPYVSNKTGDTVKYSKKLFAARGSAINHLERLMEKNGDLTGLVVECERVSDQDSAVGSIFEVKGRLKKDEIVKKTEDKSMVEPFDYLKVLAPKSDLELAAFGFAPIAGSPEDIGDVAPKETEDLNEIL